MPSWMLLTSCILCLYQKGTRDARFSLSVDVGLKPWRFAPCRKACRFGIKSEESWLGSKFSYKPWNVTIGLLVIPELPVANHLILDYTVKSYQINFPLFFVPCFLFLQVKRHGRFYPSPWSVVYHCWLIIRPYSMVVWPLSPWSMPMWHDEASLKGEECWKEETGKITENLAGFHRICFSIVFCSKICCFPRYFAYVFFVMCFCCGLLSFIFAWVKFTGKITPLCLGHCLGSKHISQPPPQTSMRETKMLIPVVRSRKSARWEGPKMYTFPVRQCFAFVLLGLSG